MLRLHARFGDEGTGGVANLSDTDGTAAGSTDLTVAGADSWGWFGGINPGFTLPVGIKQPEQRELPATSGGHPEQSGANALAPYQIAPVGFSGGGELTVNSPAMQSDAPLVGAPLSLLLPSPVIPNIADALSVGTMIINLIYDANALAAPQSFRDGMQAAANMLEGAFNDNITINIDVGYGEFNGNPLPNQNTSEGNIANGITESYSNLRTLLSNSASSTDDTTSVANLPNTSSLQGHSSFVIGHAQARALGVANASDGTLDGIVGMGTNFTGNVLISGALHELTHAMGRIAGDSLDLFRYSGVGNHVFGSAIPAPAAYFSISGGVTDIADFGINSDPGDFNNGTGRSPNDPFNENVGNLGSLTSVDLTMVDVLGFHRVDDYVQNITTTAVVATTGSGSTGSIETGGDHDWFRVTLTAGVRYRFDEHGTHSSQGTLTDTVLALWDSAGTTQLASNDDVNGAADRESEFFYTPATTGTYYVDAAAFGSNTGSYTVHVAPDDYAAGPWTTGQVSVGGSATGSVEVSGDHDWFRTSLAAGTSYRFDDNGAPHSQGTLPDTVVALWDSTGTTQLAFNDDFNGTPDSEFIYTPATSGTYYVDAGAFGSNTGTYTVHVAVLPVARDFNFDGHSDLLWQDTGGQSAIWETSGASVIGAGLTGANPGPSWLVKGSGDFNGDGYADILCQNTNGQAAVWEMNGTSLIGAGLAGPNPGPSWLVVGAGDFNADGKSDILWQNTSGQAAIWEMNGTNVIGAGLAGANPGPSWQAKGSGDFNGDGFSDILWQNSSGQAAIWEMNGTNVIGGGLAGSNPGPSWQVIGAGDFNGDGKSDILWQNTSGQAAIWEMDGTNVIGAGLVGPNPGPTWQVKGSGDVNGDGFSDITWQDTSGQAAVWELNGTNVIGAGVVGGNPGPSWHLFAG